MVSDAILNYKLFTFTFILPLQSLEDVHCDVYCKLVMLIYTQAEIDKLINVISLDKIFN